MIYTIIESIVICLVLTITEFISNKYNPLYKIYNLPLDIQDKVKSMNQYTNKIPKKKIIKYDILKLLYTFVLFFVLVYLNGARVFFQGFIFSFTMWHIILLYKILVIQCGFYAHFPQFIIPETEDLKEKYNNYNFYFSKVPNNILIGALISIIIGVFIQIIH